MTLNCKNFMLYERGREHPTTTLVCLAIPSIKFVSHVFHSLWKMRRTGHSSIFLQASWQKCMPFEFLQLT